MTALIEQAMQSPELMVVGVLAVLTAMLSHLSVDGHVTFRFGKGKRRSKEKP